MKKFLLALVAAVCLTASAFATTANEERILVRSTADAGWPEFQANLTSVKFGTGNSAIAGYSQETDTVFTAALVVWLCQNQGEPWKTACVDKVARFAAFKARNGLGDTISGADLRALAQGKGIYFPFADAPTANAPASTPVAAASAPTVVPATSGLSADEVAKVAQAAAATQLQGFDKALQALNAKAEAKAEAVTQLQKQLANAKAEAAAQQAAREKIATKVAALPAFVEAATTEAAKPIKADVARLGGDVSAFKVDVNGRVSAVEQGWFYKYQLQIAGVAVGLLALLALFGVANWRRTSKVKVIAVGAETSAAEATGAVLPVVQAVVGDLEARVSHLEATTVRYAFSFKDDELVSEVKGVAVGESYLFHFSVESDSQSRSVLITRQSEDYVLIDGIKGQTQAVKLGNVPAVIKRAYRDGRLVPMSANDMLRRAA